MAEANTKSKIDAAAEKAYEEAATKSSTASAAKVADAVEADAPKATASAKTVKKAVSAPQKKTATARKPAAKKAPAKKTAAKTATAKKTPAKKTPAARKKPAAKKTPVAAKKAAPKSATKTTTKTTVSKIKDTIMATAEKTDITAQAKEMAADVQERVKTAYAKTGELAGELGEFNKANVDAMVESGKIFFAGAQELVKDNVETGKNVVETVTEDAKKMAAVKSPTELMQLQGELARRNFDAVVSFGSQRTEAWVKLYNDAFAPISNRVSVAAEKISKAA
ncbi:phasin family protein [Erythrobacter sp. YT30]|uniref:phasin family protein n=1 Tax=Erythrobacter sp. YT30 TaxID=1735012 RepID=UPI00076C2E16|nr:phasin family protein [Erythrobacter sp. YT30]KWV91873.1 hypothetical protein AUC45_11895 [Erythrobacter sp. YT30]